MASAAVGTNTPVLLSRPLSDGEREEMTALGILVRDSDAAVSSSGIQAAAALGGDTTRGAVRKRAMQAASVLNEAYDYPRPSSFSRGIRFDLGDKTMLMISGTASVDEAGLTKHAGDFRAQLWRTYRNITELLASEGATWRDIVRTTCYLRDIERDYKDFNEIRTAFFRWLGLDPLPASTGIQARLCREDLLVEIEAIAVIARSPANQK
jgi:enamine deaminase RidA (YjgF/YER057c/UK114 family)